MISRDNVKLVAVAAFCLTVGLAGPSVAGAVQSGLNADQVDDKHAVGAKASIAQRKGKLVATSPTTGRLPDNIIATAPNSAKLGGATAASLRRLTFSSASLWASAGEEAGGINLLASESRQFSLTFSVPPEHPQGGTVMAEIVWVAMDDACGFQLQAYGSAFRTTLGDGIAGSWLFPNGNYQQTVSVRDVSDQYPIVAGRTTIEWDQPVNPGDLLVVTVTRATGDVADTCPNVYIHGVDVLY